MCPISLQQPIRMPYLFGSCFTFFPLFFLLAVPLVINHYYLQHSIRHRSRSRQCKAQQERRSPLYSSSTPCIRHRPSQQHDRHHDIYALCGALTPLEVLPCPLFFCLLRNCPRTLMALPFSYSYHSQFHNPHDVIYHDT